LPAAPTLDLGQGQFGWHPRAIRPVRGHRVVRIRDGDDAPKDRDTVAGQATTLTGNATDPDGNLSWLHFYVNGPGLPGWNYAGSVQVGGGDATGSISWTPSQPGSYAVHVRAEDSWGWWDWNANVANGFNVSVANASPQTNWVSATNTTVGQASTFTGNANYPAGSNTTTIVISPATPPLVPTWKPGNRMEVFPAEVGRPFVSVTLTAWPSVTTSVGPGTCMVPQLPVVMAAGTNCPAAGAVLQP